MSKSMPLAIALGLGLAAWGFFPLHVTSVEAQTSAGSPISNSFMRVAAPTTNNIQLEILIRELVPAKAGSPVVSLVGVSHVGASNYYASIQQHLDRQALVLFEGVRHADAVDDEPAADPGEANSAPLEVDESSIQFTLAKSLGLEFQLSAIDYRRAHFRNSDMSIAQIGRVLSGGRESRPPTAEAPVESGRSQAGASAEFAMLMQVMDGTSVIGRIANGLVRFLGSSPKLQGTTRLAMIELLGNLQGDLTEMAALPPDLKRLLTVLLHARNAVVVNDLKKELRQTKPAPTIAVFYGAAHMSDLEKRICEELGYQRGHDQWLPAISVDLPAAGLTAVDHLMVRNLIDWQMKLLQQPRPEPRQP